MVRETFEADPSFKVTCVETGEQALERLSKSEPDLMILDWNLPDRSGKDLCKLLRNNAATAGLPILMLTALTGVNERVDALDSGADDYVPKPFYVQELRARVHAILRRKSPWLVQGPVLEFKGLRIEPSNYRAYVQGKDIGLTKLEFEIFYLLAVNAGRLIQRRYIESRALEMEFPTDSRPLDVHMSRIREKLGARLAGRIETVRGVGYLFSPEPAA